MADPAPNPPTPSPPPASPPPAAAPPTPAAVPPSPPARRHDEWRPVVGRLISIGVLCGVVLLVFLVWAIIEHHPRTDDAIVEANVIGVAPRVGGEIIKLNVQDNQDVKEGDVLFEIDPADYQLALESAEAALASLEQQITVARSQDDVLKYQVKAAAAEVESAKAQLKQTTDTLNRLEPLLPKGYATAEDVDKAHTAVAVATAAVANAEERFNQAKAALSTLATLQAQRPGAAAAVNQAKLNLSYCKIVALFPGRVVNLNLSVGAYVSIGQPIFSLLDTRKWYVLANFREGEIRHFGPGAEADVYLMSAPRRHFKGIVQGIGSAVKSPDYIDTSTGVPNVPRELNWVHIAQRFPVRIEVLDPDPHLFRKGATAVAIIKSRGTLDTSPQN